MAQCFAQIPEPSEFIHLRNVSKVYDGAYALEDITLYIRRHEFVTLLGPSGCGKTTTLRIIGGFETPSSGTVMFDGADLLKIPPYRRRINTVFQRYALFPHLNVFDNIAFGPKLRKVSQNEINARVEEMLEMVNLRGLGKRSVEQLSGGQQQRVAIARALVNKPEVLLLDEPLGALDLKLRKEMQVELKNMQQQLGITFLYVTHDQEEALTMSDIIVVMNDGRIQQIGTPKDIYDEPKNSFVADFIGESNILSGVMEQDEFVTFAGHTFRCVDKGFGKNQPVDVVVRPEDIEVVDKENGMITGMVESVVFKGVHYEMMVNCGAITFRIHSTTMEPAGSEVGLCIVPFNIHIMVKNP